MLDEYVGKDGCASIYLLFLARARASWLMRLGKKKRSKDIYGWDDDNQPQPRKMHKGVRVMRDSLPTYLPYHHSLRSSKPKTPSWLYAYDLQKLRHFPCNR